MEAPPSTDESTDAALRRMFLAANPKTDGAPGAARDAEAEDVPTRLGRYEIGRQIGVGTTASVFAGVDVDLGRPVAVKWLRAGVSRQRLVREAQALAQLRHPNVVAFYEIGEHNGRLFIVMELIDGRSLKEVLERDRLSRDEILRLFRQAGHGLQAAHTAGLVHRDFKPANVLVGLNKQVAVADFGLVKAHDADEKGPDTATSAPDSIETMTAVGTLLGTPYFMAPEQLNSGNIDAKADQYAFCLSLWLAFYHRHPMADVPGPQRYQLGTWQTLRRSPSQGIPRWLHQVIVRGLHPDPDQRWPSMGSLIDRLSRSPLRRFLRRMAIGLTLVISISGLSQFFSAFQAAKQQEQVARDHEREALEYASGTADHATDQTLVLAARLARDDPTTAYLLMREVQRPEEVLGWFSSAVGIWHKPISRAVLRGHTDHVRSIAFNPDGTLIATASSDGAVRIWRADGRGSPAVLRGHLDRVHIVNFSPDGKLLVTGSRDRTAMVWDLAHLDAPAALEGHSDIVWWAGFSPDGRWIATTSRDGTARLWDATVPELWSNPPPPAQAVLQGHQNQVWWGEFHPDSTHLVTASKDETARIWSVLDPEAEPLVLADHKTNLYRARFSPDGTHVVTSGADPAVWLWPLAGGAPKILQGQSPFMDDAAFNKDGRRVLTAKSYFGTPRVWDTNSGNLITELKGGPNFSDIGAFGGNDQWIAVGHYNGCVEVWHHDDHENPVRLCGSGETLHNLASSPDGSSLVTSTHSGVIRVWDATSWNTGARISIMDGGIFVSRDQTSVAIVNHKSTELSVFNLMSSTMGPTMRPPAEQSFVHSDISNAGNQIVSITDRGVVSLWNFSTGEMLWQRSGDFSSGRLATFLGENRVGAVGSDGDSWLLLDRNTGILESRHRTGTGAILGFVSTPDGHRAATVTNKGVVQLWEIGTNRPPTEIARRSDTRGGFIALAPAGSALAVVKGGAWVFDMYTGVTKFSAERGIVDIFNAAISHTGRIVALMTVQGTVEVWDVQTGRKLDEFYSHQASALSFSIDERLLAVAELTGGHVRIRDFSSAEWAGETDLITHPRAVRFIGDTDDLLVMGRDQGLFRLQIGTMISAGVTGLLNRPGRSTTACLTAQQRITLVGQPRLEAVLRSIACDVGHGRFDRIWPELRTGWLQ